MIIEENVKLAKYCTWHTGGLARYFIRVKTITEASEALEWGESQGLRHFILGNGSNSLFSDSGFGGVVIKPEARRVRVEGVRVVAEAGAIIRSVATFAAEHNLSGMEHLAGIPGTVGGAVRGNAGSLGSEIRDVLEKVLVLRKTVGAWETKILTKEELGFGYRNSEIKKNQDDYLVWEATFSLVPGERDVILQEIKNDLEVRRAKQPYEFPSAGSVFKNPGNGMFAAKLIEEAGCKGLVSGAAQVSEKHANFIINKGGATSTDILTLISEVKKKVMEKSGVELEEEVVLVGE